MTMVPGSPRLFTDSRAGDIYEAEADRVAEQVMNSGVEKQQSGIKGGGGIIQTKPG